jgi:hypothetical protein
MAAVVAFGCEPVFIHRNSVLHLSFDGSALLGGMAPAGYEESIADFAQFEGETASGVVALAERHHAEELMAKAISCLIDLAEGDIVGAAEFYATYPDDWPQERLAPLRLALDELGLRQVALIPSADVRTPRAAALEAALLAHTAVLGKSENPTSPGGDRALTASVGALAYSALPAPLPEVRTGAAIETEPSAAAEPVSRPRTPLVVAAVVMLGLAGLVVGVALHSVSDRGSRHAGGPPASTTAVVTFSVRPLAPQPPPVSATPVAAPVVTARARPVAPRVPVEPTTIPTRAATSAIAKSTLPTTDVTITATPVPAVRLSTTAGSPQPDIGPLPSLFGPSVSATGPEVSGPSSWETAPQPGATSDPATGFPTSTTAAGPVDSGPGLPYKRYSPQ